MKCFQLEIVVPWPEVVADPLFYSTRKRTTVNRRLVGSPRVTIYCKPRTSILCR